MANSQQYLFLIVLASWAVASFGAPNLACLQEIMPCQKYMKNPEGKIPDECCKPLKEQLTKSNDENSCICTVFADKFYMMQSGITTTEDAMKLPKACGIKPDTSKCRSAPAGADDASSFIPESALSTSPSGSPTGAPAPGPSNNGASRFGISGFSAFVIAALVFSAAF